MAGRIVTRYAFVPGSTFHGDADAVQDELERIRRTGGLTPEAVVVAARPKRSVLHGHVFNVDRETAAERYYKHRAALLIRAVVKCDDVGDPTPVRAYVRVVRDDTSRYVSIDDDGARNAAIERLKRDMAALQTQLRALEMYPLLTIALEEAIAASREEVWQ
jgi:hypothetical protein